MTADVTRLCSAMVDMSWWSLGMAAAALQSCYVAVVMAVMLWSCDVVVVVAVTSWSCDVVVVDGMAVVAVVVSCHVAVAGGGCVVVVVTYLGCCCRSCGGSRDKVCGMGG